MPVQSTPPAAAAQCDLAALIDPLAQHFFGEPNARLSSKHELRFGTHGSLIVHLKKGTWYNHEAQTGGGAIDLVKLLMRWLEAEGWRHKQTSRPERDPERDNLPFADRIRRASVPIAGTSGAAYLVARGIALDAVPEGGGLRVHPRCPWQSDTAPCIVARFTDTITREPLGIHRRPTGRQACARASLAALREAAQRRRAAGNISPTTNPRASATQAKGERPAWPQKETPGRNEPSGANRKTHDEKR
jgi:hypothetical protein